MSTTPETIPTIGTPSPYAVWCPNHGEQPTRVYMTPEQYSEQMFDADAQWLCPACLRSGVVFEEPTGNRGFRRSTKKHEDQKRTDLCSAERR